MTDHYIARGTSIAARGIDNETMIMSATNSELFVLNPVATVIWNAADGQVPLAQLVKSAVCTQFEADPETCLPDAEAFAEELARHGVLVLSDQPITPALGTIRIAGSEDSAASVTAPVSRKRPYERPAFRHERVFETMALSCGKVNLSQPSCRFNRKNS
jgi:hypothetical protein